MPRQVGTNKIGRRQYWQRWSVVPVNHASANQSNGPDDAVVFVVSMALVSGALNKLQNVLYQLVATFFAA